jgi:hypothetical protein
MPASDLEERFNKAVSKHPSVRGVEFRLSLGAPRGLPGWLELDYLLDTVSGYRAFEVDDITFIHKGERERQEGLIKDQRRLFTLKSWGLGVREIEHVTNEKLGTQEEANRWARENL